jgi:enoyl-CoA hydratase/carnithine racemase
MKLERTDSVAVLHLIGGKANAMSAPLLERLHDLVEQAELSGAKALVITGYETFFSAGLSLPPLVGLERDAMRAFMLVFERAMLRVFRCGLPVVAAVNGHAVAGGCVLALQCDVRLMADGPYKIGLNEVRIGLGLPASVIETLRLAVGVVAQREIALGGALYLPEDAKRVGLVDEVVPTADLLPRAIARAGQATGLAYAQIKRALRQPALDAYAARAETERERWLDTWYAPEAQRFVAETVARLSKPTS